MIPPPVAPPAAIVIFGATGDLARRLLAPALANLEAAGLLDAATRIVGISIDAGDDAILRERLAGFVTEPDAYARLADRITYLQGGFTDDALYPTLAEQLDGPAMFYLATAPNFFAEIATRLSAAGLLAQDGGFRRIVIEKPFGRDLASAQALNGTLLSLVGEDQIYRIDHFLGKETVQNILVTRFGNAITEAIWNNRYIDHVQITAAETVAVGTRGRFYDATGALRDMVPNHLFQLLALVGMEPPSSLDAEAIRNERAKVVGAIRPIDPADAVRGRYLAGAAGGEDVPDYRATPDVAADSRTETYVAVKLAVDTWRWAGVPFYLRTGKALSARDTEIVVRFKEAPPILFHGDPDASLPANQIILRLQPNEGVAFEMAVKRPGPVVAVAPARLDFAYADLFTLTGRTGYETLLFDVLIGDQTLFQRADQIEAGWRAVEPLLHAWAAGEPKDYPAGTAGPDGADALLARDGRAWHAIA